MLRTNRVPSTIPTSNTRGNPASRPFEGDLEETNFLAKATVLTVNSLRDAPLFRQDVILRELGGSDGGPSAGLRRRLGLFLSVFFGPFLGPEVLLLQGHWGKATTAWLFGWGRRSTALKFGQAVAEVPTLRRETFPLPFVRSLGGEQPGLCFRQGGCQGSSKR